MLRSPLGSRSKAARGRCTLAGACRPLSAQREAHASHESRQRTNLEAFGFHRRHASTIPRVVGPRSTSSTRGSTCRRRSSICRRSTRHGRRIHNVEAARHSSHRSARDLVVLVAANAYWRRLRPTRAPQSARAQLQTSQGDLPAGPGPQAGRIVAGIDVVRAEVRLNANRQQVTASQNDLEKSAAPAGPRDWASDRTGVRRQRAAAKRAACPTSRSSRRSSRPIETALTTSRPRNAVRAAEATHARRLSASSSPRSA